MARCMTDQLKDILFSKHAEKASTSWKAKHTVLVPESLGGRWWVLSLSRDWEPGGALIDRTYRAGTDSPS